MTERIRKMRKFYIEDRAHRSFRRPPLDWEKLLDLPVFMEQSDLEKVTRVFEIMLEREHPVIFPEERLPLLRTVVNFPYFIFEQTVRGRKIHENGMLSNICVDYSRLLSCGLDQKLTEIEARLTGLARNPGENAGQIEELSAMRRHLAAILELCERYRRHALEKGIRAVSDVLSRLPGKLPETFQEALCMLRILHYALWASGAYHNTLGRLDQLLYPYYQKDIAGNRLTKEEALELLEEFFLCCNKDSDLYIGVQQGDNGQSVVLGGRDRNGVSQYNELSELCLRASLELRVIDPKINLRVDSNTPAAVYELGTALTRTGLGFPQYLNDDVNIRALTDWGYALEDACNYSAAACWELIIPGKGMEIPNVGGLSFAGAAQRAIRNHLEECTDFESLLTFTKAEIQTEADAICADTAGITILPAPLHSLMMSGCLESGRDVTQGCVYNNYGLHGAGLSTAADMLAGVERFVYHEGRVTKAGLLDALDRNFSGCDRLFHLLRYDGPKMGRDDRANEIGASLLEMFADSLEGKRNDRNGIFRAGTGSAMFYIEFSKNLPATADGRHAGEPIPANYSPGLFARCDGPVSVVTSFAGPGLSRVANGGPLTLELHDSMFRNPEAISKTALLVKSFVRLGGHQLQLNAVNRDQMIDAQKHPEDHRNLIVRVWGWSGYFIELDKEYQDHIIARCEYTSADA